MFFNFRKVKRQLRIHILLDFTYTRVIFLIKRHSFTYIISYICKKIIKNFTYFILFGN